MVHRTNLVAMPLFVTATSPEPNLQRRVTKLDDPVLDQVVEHRDHSVPFLLYPLRSIGAEGSCGRAFFIVTLFERRHRHFRSLSTALI